MSDKKPNKKVKKNNNKLIIQDLDEYLEEMNLKNAKKLRPNEYDEMCINRTCKQDDVLSITPGIEAPPYSRLYASLLTVKYLQDVKNTYITKYESKKENGDTKKE